MKTRYFLLLILTFLLQGSPSFATWQKISQFSKGSVSAIFFFDPLNGFVGLKGANSILRTTDGGKTWSPTSVPALAVATNLGPWIGDIWFRSNSEGWATRVYGQSDGMLLHTIDGGTTWTASLTGNGNSVRQTTRALVVTQWNGPGLTVSTDGGASFGNSFGVGINGLDFVDDLNGAASGFQNVFYFSSDGGVTWQPSQTGSNTEGWGIYGVKGTSTFLTVPESLGGAPVSSVFRSDNFGRDWKKIATLPFKANGDVKGSGATLYVQKSSESFSTSPDGLYRTTDLGLTWTSVGGPSNGSDNRIAVSGCGNVLYAADATGGLYNSMDGGDGLITAGTGKLGEEHFALGVSKDPVRPTDTLQVSISGDLPVKGVGLRTISGVIEYYDDAFEFLSASAQPGLTFVQGGVARIGKTAHLRFGLSSASEIALDPSIPILQAKFKTLLSDSLQIPFSIDSLLLNEANPNFATCVLASREQGTVAHIELACGDGTIQNQLLGKPLLSITTIHPDPLMLGSYQRATIELNAAQNGTAEITLTNLFGDVIRHDPIELRSGSQTRCQFDLTNCPAGTYFYQVVFRTATERTVQHGTFIVVH